MKKENSKHSKEGDLVTNVDAEVECDVAKGSALCSFVQYLRISATPTAHQPLDSARENLYSSFGRVRAARQSVPLQEQVGSRRWP